MGFGVIAIHFITIGLTGCQEGNSSQDPAKKYNIVFILADDLGYGDLGCFGATKVQTPRIDRLASEGVSFTNAYSPHSVCTPTRYSLMTGRYAWRTWNGHETVWANDPMLIDSSRTTLPEILKSAGYRTAIIGKWHLGFGSPNSPGWDDQEGPDYNLELNPGPLEAGFDYFYGIPHVGQQPHMFIENHHVVGLDPDEPMEIILDERYTDRASYVNRDNMPPAHKFKGYGSARYEHEDVAVILTDKAVKWIEAESNEPFFLYFAHRNIHTPLKPNDRFANSSEIGKYGDFIHELDWSVGEILDALDRMGLTDNTIVFLASDNGGVKDYQDSKIIEIIGHRPNGPFFGQKTECYEGGVHIPFIVKWPGVVQKNSKSEKLVALTDTYATIAELLNHPLLWNEGEDSFSYLSELQGTLSDQPERQCVVTDSKCGLFAIRKGDWKFITGQGGGGAHWNEDEHVRIVTHKWNYKDDADNPPGQLYNLRIDPGETNNLYYSHPEKVAELRDKLREIQYSGRSRD